MAGNVNSNMNLNSTELSAQLRAHSLDQKDGKVDGKIEASIWNEFAKTNGGNEVKNYITTDNAKEAIMRYSDEKSQNVDDIKLPESSNETKPETGVKPNSNDQRVLTVWTAPAGEVDFNAGVYREDEKNKEGGNDGDVVSNALNKGFKAAIGGPFSLIQDKIAEGRDENHQPGTGEKIANGIIGSMLGPLARFFK